MSTKKNLMNAILEVRKASGNVLKRGTNTYHNYSYATANDVIKEVRDLMNEHQLITYPIEQKDISYHKEGTVEELTQVFEIYHVESGESMSVSIRAAGEDKGDKRAYKANTGALKYLLIQLFLLPTDDDPENDAKDKKAAPQQRQQPAQGGAQPGSQPSADRAWLNEGSEEWNKAIEYLRAGGNIATIEKKYKVSKASKAKLEPFVKPKQEVVA